MSQEGNIRQRAQQAQQQAPDAANPDPSVLLAKKPINKPGPGSRTNEEDEFSTSRFIKAMILTALVIGLIVLFFYHVSVVIEKTYFWRYSSFMEFFFIGILGLVVNVSVSVKSVRFLNKIMFLKEDQEMAKKFS